jgi:hypothetical protein
MWSVRPRGTSTAPISVGTGDFTMEYAEPEPDPVPVTTIAWRICHMLVGVFGMRVAGHFGGEPVEYETYDYPGDAATVLARLDEVYAACMSGVRGLGDEDLRQPCGPAEGPFADKPMATLVLHINREALHHSAEIALPATSTAGSTSITCPRARHGLRRRPYRDSPGRRLTSASGTCW